eukprot:364058-Chlamydomonas_euryale.AAC.6
MRVAPVISRARTPNHALSLLNAPHLPSHAPAPRIMHFSSSTPHTCHLTRPHPESCPCQHPTPAPLQAVKASLPVPARNVLVLPFDLLGDGDAIAKAAAAADAAFDGAGIDYLVHNAGAGRMTVAHHARNLEGRPITRATWTGGPSRAQPGGEGRLRTGAVVVAVL